MDDFVYELKPSVCLIGGVITLILGDNILAALSGLILFFSGSYIWICRSDARRKDKIYGKRAGSNQHPINWYEIKPFASIAAGLIIPYFNLHALVFFAVLLLIWSGTYILIMRATNRKYAF